MASDTVIASPDPAAEAPTEPRRPWPWVLPGSRLGRLIVALNLLGLAILIGGALVLNELSRGLIHAEIDSLTTQGAFIASVIVGGATSGDPAPTLDPAAARETLQLLFIPRSQRARVFDARGNLIADSYVIADMVETRPLPPPRKRGALTLPFAGKHDPSPAAVAQARTDLAAEVSQALQGESVTSLRRTANGERVVSVSIPIEHVRTVLGVLTLEAGDVDRIVSAQRRALLPFIAIAVAVTLASSFLLSRLIGAPMLRLARAADRVTAQRERAIHLPDIARRGDEIGDLARSLETMTSTLSQRMDAIEHFAADVAHEIRNPLTSIRSAVETLDLVSDPPARDRLTGILKQDVGRLDRLITDISNASRLDAELSRDAPRPLDLERLLTDITSFYAETAGPADPSVRFIRADSLEPITVFGRNGPLSQVFRNLIDNARSFSPPAGDGDGDGDGDGGASEVRVSLQRQGRNALVAVEDDGPGLPPENLETVFERFYTSRPAGAAFGGHSGLGLSIARQIVDAHGGVIHAENRVDAAGRVVGARFVVALPERRG